MEILSGYVMWGVIAVAVLFAANLMLVKARKGRFVPIDCLCTKTESNFFRQLIAKLPSNYHVAPKVRLADICLPRNKRDIRFFNSIAQKHIDFVVVDSNTSKIMFAIELDDASHLSRSAYKRDQIKNKALHSAGVQLFRVKPQRNYTQFITEMLSKQK